MKFATAVLLAALVISGAKAEDLAIRHAPDASVPTPEVRAAPALATPLPSSLDQSR
jgi:hypothetical protein